MYIPKSYRTGAFKLVESLMQRIERLLPKLSKGQKLIAKYIQTEYGKAAFMTAAKLGETVGVSESLATADIPKCSRLCRK